MVVEFTLQLSTESLSITTDVVKFDFLAHEEVTLNAVVLKSLQ